MEKNSFVINQFKGQITDELMLLAKVLQSVIDALIDIGRCCGMQTNVGKINIMRFNFRFSSCFITASHFY